MDSHEEPPEPTTAGGAEQERCPRCGAPSTPVAYGYPSVEMFEAAERGEVVLGGCILLDGRPSARCPVCAADVGSLTSPSENERD